MLQAQQESPERVPDYPVPYDYPTVEGIRKF
jgi:hypothetical protein